MRMAPVALFFLAAAGAGDDWPEWRGPERTGRSAETGLPLRWSASENLAWKLPLPERSGSTPIVWGERVFLSVASGDRLELWCVDRGKGAPLWKRPLGGGNVSPRKHNMSSPSPVTDGRTVWVITGTGILKAFDLAGAERWSRDIQKDYGRFGLQWGYASSPLLHDGALFVQVLHGMNTDAASYLLRIHGGTGKTVWRVERPTQAVRESPDAYTTPALARRGDQAEVVVSGGDCVTGHDPATGKELWRANGLNPEHDGNYRIVASPVAVGDVVFVPSRVRPLLAVRCFGRGDVTRTHRAWSFDHGPDVPTPAADATYLYVVTDKGIVFCLDVRTGARMYGPERIRPGTYSASPVLADGKAYATSEDGVTTVYRAGPRFEALAENSVDELTLSSLAVSDGQLFLRTEKHLYCIGPRRAATGEPAQERGGLRLKRMVTVTTKSVGTPSSSRGW
jgi:outer membrane protein assembly factor BamB